MEDRILLVKVTIKTMHTSIHDAIQELQAETVLQGGSTPKRGSITNKNYRTEHKKLKTWHIK